MTDKSTVQHTAIVSIELRAECPLLYSHCVDRCLAVWVTSSNSAAEVSVCSHTVAHSLGHVTWAGQGLEGRRQLGKANPYNNKKTCEHNIFMWLLYFFICDFSLHTFICHHIQLHLLSNECAKTCNWNKGSKSKAWGICKKEGCVLFKCIIHLFTVNIQLIYSSN